MNDGRIVVRSTHRITVPAVLLLFSAVAGAVFADSNAPNLSLYVELDRAFAAKIGVEYRFADQLGVKASAGVSLLGFTMFAYNILGVYHITDFDNPFQADIEVGLPLAYLDLLGEDGPFVGWVPGVSLALGYQNPEVFRIGLRVGAGCHLEITRGEIQTPRPLMDVGIESNWYIW